MAFSLSGLLGRIYRPSLLGVGLHFPEVDVQARNYAARKGTRAKALKKKIAMKLKKAAQARSQGITTTKNRKNVIQMTKTCDADRKELPTDLNIYYQQFHKYKPHSITEAVKYLREDNHPTITNNPGGRVHVLIEFNMIGVKKTKFVDPWKSTVPFPHKFDTGSKSVVWVICDTESIEKAIEGGADAAGDASLIKKIKEGEAVLNRVDRLICHLKYVEQISAIRSKLKQLAPRVSNETLTADPLASLYKFKYGVEYAVERSESDKSFGWTELKIGALNMDPEHLEDNFVALLKNIHQHGPRRKGEFISWIWCTCPPSKMRYKIDAEPYLEKLESPWSKKAEEEETGEAEEAARASA